MIRKAALGVALVAFIVGAFASDVMALRGRHATTVNITSAEIVDGNIVVQGSLSSSYRNCTRYRQVGLWFGQNFLKSKITDTYGKFTITAPSVGSGTYTVYAYREYATGQCGHLCKMGSTQFSL